MFLFQEPNSATLTWEYKIKSSTNATAEHACTLLTQAALALKETNKNYVETLFALVILMEYRLKVLGNIAEEERIWDLILEARQSVSDLKRKKQMLEMTVSSAHTLVNTSAELAYFVGEDIMGSVSGERLNKVELFLRDCQREAEEAEAKLRDVEAKTVTIEGKYADKLEKAGKLAELAGGVSETEETGVTDDASEETAADTNASGNADEGQDDAGNESQAESEDVQAMYEVFRGPLSRSVIQDYGSTAKLTSGGRVNLGNDDDQNDDSDAKEIDDKFGDSQKPDKAEEIVN